MNRFVWKLVLNGIVVIPLLYWFTNASLIGIVITAILLAVVSYLIGDQFILRRTNNFIATLVDAAIAFAFLWVIAGTFNWTLSVGELFSIVLFVGIVEAIYHSLLLRVWGESNELVDEAQYDNRIEPRLATQEFSEELGRKESKKEDKDEEDPNIYRWDD